MRMIIADEPPDKLTYLSTRQDNGSLAYQGKPLHSWNWSRTLWPWIIQVVRTQLNLYERRFQNKANAMFCNVAQSHGSWKEYGVSIYFSDTTAMLSSVTCLRYALSGWMDRVLIQMARGCVQKSAGQATLYIYKLACANTMQTLGFLACLPSITTTNVQWSGEARDGTVFTPDRGFGQAALPQCSKHILTVQRVFGQTLWKASCWVLHEADSFLPYEKWMPAGVLNIVTCYGKCTRDLCWLNGPLRSQSLSGISEGFRFEQRTRHKGLHGAVMFIPLALRMKSVRSLYHPYFLSEPWLGIKKVKIQGLRLQTGHDTILRKVKIPKQQGTEACRSLSL